MFGENNDWRHYEDIRNLMLLDAFAEQLEIELRYDDKSEPLVQGQCISAPVPGKQSVPVPTNLGNGQRLAIDVGEWKKSKPSITGAIRPSIPS